MWVTRFRHGGIEWYETMEDIVNEAILGHSKVTLNGFVSMVIGKFRSFCYVTMVLEDLADEVVKKQNWIITLGKSLYLGLDPIGLGRPI